MLDFTGNTRKQACTCVQGIIFSRAGKKGNGSTSLSRPKTSPVLAEVGVSSTIIPAHDPEHQVPRPNRKPAHTAAAANRDSVTQNLPIPANIPQPKSKSIQIHLKTSKTHLVAKINLPRPHPSSLEPFGGASYNQVRERSLSRRRRTLNETPVCLTCSFVFFFFCSVAGEAPRRGSFPERLHTKTFRYSLLDSSCSAFALRPCFV